MDVAVEDEAHHLAAGVEQRAARVAADDVVVGGEVDARRHVELGAHAFPGRGDLERRLARGTLERATELRVGFDRRTALRPALHGAVVQAQREGRIRVDLRAVDLEAGAGDLLLGGRDRRLHLVVVALAQRTGRRVDLACELDHRVVGGRDRGAAAVPERETHRGVGELRPIDELGRQRVRRVLGEQLAHGGVVRAEPLAHALEAEGHRQTLDLRVDGRRRPELLLHAGQLRIGELAQTLAVRLLALGRAAHQRARDAEQAALEAGAALEVGVLGAEVARAGGRLLDVGPGVADPGERGVLGHAGAQLGLIGALLRHELLVEQRIELLAAHLDAVLEAEQRIGDDAALRVALLRELDVAAAQLAAAQQPLRQVVVAL